MNHKNNYRYVPFPSWVFRLIIWLIVGSLAIAFVAAMIGVMFMVTAMK